MQKSLYRIIDANFNRAREALRVIEEFCRFALNCEPLTERTKQLRHELASFMSQLDQGRLIAARDTLADVGAGKTVQNQISRTDLKDCFTAAAKRLPEALRVLGEMTQTLNPDLAQKIENLRFAAYALEKDVTIAGDTTEKFGRVRLYVIISSSLPADVISLTQKCIAGAADCIQLRAKDMQDNELFALAEQFTQLCRDANVLSIINDRADVAVASAADGVHLGQSNLPIEQARKIQLTPLIIGQTTHTIEQLCRACKQDPTYVSLGPVFATSTKPGLKPVGLEYVTKAAEALTSTGICHVAVGGINLDNIGRVIDAGAEKIAVCSAVTGTPDPAEACRALKQKINTLKAT